MSPTMKDLGIDRLGVDERIVLALEIWDSLGDAEPTSSLSAEKREILSRRIAELDADPSIALTWEEIRASVERVP